MSDEQVKRLVDANPHWTVPNSFRSVLQACNQDALLAEAVFAEIHRRHLDSEARRADEASRRAEMETRRDNEAEAYRLELEAQRTEWQKKFAESEAARHREAQRADDELRRGNIVAYSSFLTQLQKQCSTDTTSSMFKVQATLPSCSSTAVPPVTVMPAWMPTSVQRILSMEGATVATKFENTIATLMDEVHALCRETEEKRFSRTTGGIPGTSRVKPDLTRYSSSQCQWLSNAVSFVEVKYYQEDSSSAKALGDATQQVISRVMVQFSYVDLEVVGEVTMRCGIFTQAGFYQVLVRLNQVGPRKRLIVMTDVLECTCSELFPWPSDGTHVDAATAMIRAISGWLYADAAQTLRTLRSPIPPDVCANTPYTLHSWLRRSFEKPQVYVVHCSTTEKLLLWKEYQKDISAAKCQKEISALVMLQGVPNVPQFVTTLHIPSRDATVILSEPVGMPILTLTSAEFLDAGCQLLRAMIAASRKGIQFHGDVSVNNIVRCLGGKGEYVYVLIDWGEAETVVVSDTNTSPKVGHTCVTTWLFAHPSLKASGTPTWNTDAFALVMSLIALLAARWPGDNARSEVLLSYAQLYQRTEPQIAAIITKALGCDAPDAVLPSVDTWLAEFA